MTTIPFLFMIPLTFGIVNIATAPGPSSSLTFKLTYFNPSGVFGIPLFSASSLIASPIEITGIPLLLNAFATSPFPEPGIPTKRIIMRKHLIGSSESSYKLRFPSTNRALGSFRGFRFFFRIGDSKHLSFKLFLHLQATALLSTPWNFDYAPPVFKDGFSFF
ncbi:161aa long hypothetical protein [Pyrococcus horikoshii OT3]|uniref:Uncharacterized protein n=1 Tax=Pyrococcus horikoshii (strain ATCC 700860 / DSM 12428 / JCM 9974 / NBRC 100139 / OT-3) TaxID=70601 RepID=O58735_PYRHO|nr:161aa long hypothetical protein [Pyrococcus horikoshii OT3]